MKEEFVEDILVTTLLFWVKKIRHGGCTREQEMALLNLLDNNADTMGTPDEIADFYGKSKEAVYNVIKRNYIGKPKRNIVMYSFSRFRDAAPKSWKPCIGHVNIEESSE